MELTVSFIIPAFNEAHHLPRTLTAITAQAPATLGYEVIVVDNGSSDGTRQIALHSGARVVDLEQGTVAALRNAGARIATGTLLVFLDADVALGPGWGARLEALTPRLVAGPRVLTGSRVRAPQEGNWLQRRWYGALAAGPSRYVNSGHLLITRALFDELGGFDPSLATGEDCDLSRRALAAGAEVVNDPALAAIHFGFPATLADLFRREMWHGKGDFGSWRRFRGSNVAQATVGFVALHLLLLAPLLGAAPWLAAVGTGGIAAGCGAAAWRSFRHAPAAMLVVNSIIYYVYFAGRTASLVAALADTVDGRGHRARAP